MAGMIFYKQRHKVGTGEKKPRFRVVGVAGCDLRLYAVRIDQNVFTITGGAIKMSQAMQDHPNTAQALRDLDVTRRYLQEHGVVDDSGFYEIVSH